MRTYLPKWMLCILAVIIIPEFFCSYLQAEKDGPTVVSIAGFRGLPGEYTARTIRRRVITTLVQDYDCVVANRIEGYNVTLEESLHKLASITNQSWADFKVIAADYVVTGYMEHSGKGDEIQGDISYTDLSKEFSGSSEPPKKSFSSTRWPNACLSIPDQIAAMLSLKKRDGAQKQEKNNLLLTWAVLPFTRLDAPIEHNVLIKDSKPFRSADDPAINVEASLSENQVHRRLVDHKIIDKVLLELKASAFDRSDAGMMARILGADRILAGSISSSGNGKSLWIDEHLIDGKTAIIIDACGCLVNSREDIPSKAAELALKLAERDLQVPAALKPSRTQTRKEAEVYLSMQTSFNPVYYPDLMIDHAEAAYLLEHGDEDFTYKIALKLARLVGWMIPQQGGLIYNPTDLTRAANIINNILQPMAHSQNTPAPLLIRAEMLICIGRYSEALRLTEQHKRDNPHVDVARANTLQAECEFELKHIDRAKTILDDVVSRFGQTERTLHLSHKISKSQHDDRAEYESLKKQYEGTVSVKDPFEDNKRVRYLELARKHDGPEKALEKGLRINPGRILSNTDVAICLQNAKSLLALGRKEEAARICDDIVSVVLSPFAHNNREAAKMLKEIEVDIGKLKPVFKKAADVRGFPDKYQICLVPVVGANADFMKRTAGKLGTYLGINIAVSSAISIPETARVDGSMQYDATRMISGLLNCTTVPDNTLLLVYLTEKSIKVPKEYSYISFYSPTKGNPVLIDYVEGRWADRNDFLDWRANEIMWRIASTLRHCYMAQMGKHVFPWDVLNCKNPICIFSQVVNMAGQGLRFEMCPSCQAEYKKADFDKIHNDLMDYLKKAGATIVKAEK